MNVFRISRAHIQKQGTGTALIPHYLMLGILDVAKDIVVDNSVADDDDG
jgi:hypothetical protein